MDRTRIGFVVGLTAEARLLRGCGFAIGVGGGAPAGAAVAAGRLVDDGAQALISFGLAGGLDPALPAGAVLVPDLIVEAGTSFVCDPGLVAWLGRTGGALLAGESVAVTAADKAALFAQTGAAAIDLESGAVARVAAARGVNFAVLRAICDPAGRNLPPAALVALNQVGKIGFLRVLASVIREPSQIAGLLALARDAAAARAALAGRLQRLK
jgi:adenosylhomocysteine nucleosidase